MRAPDDWGDDGDDAADGAPAAESPVSAELVIPEEAAGLRLDRALALAAPEGVSRSRIAEALRDGRLRDAAGMPVADGRRKARSGERFALLLPAPVAARPEAEAIPLAVLHEDAHLIVVDKPAGMVVHPAPGAERGTLVNALLHHCGDSLAGIGGERRPGIVHRLDKDTSGVMVAAKTEAALAGLAAAFAAHDVDREYLAILHGLPDPAEPRLAGLPSVAFEPGGVIRIDAAIARHPTDRKRMAVRPGGRRAVTRLSVLERFGTVASLAACRLETGRTHQIRVHATHVGHPLVGDPVYGRRRTLPGTLAPDIAAAISDFSRQALHARRLGFVHPATGRPLVFETAPPSDFAALLDVVRQISFEAR